MPRMKGEGQITNACDQGSHHNCSGRVHTDRWNREANAFETDPCACECGHSSAKSLA